MNQAPFKVPVSQWCLVGAVVVSWSLIQEVAGSISFKYSAKTFRENSKSPGGGPVR